MKKQLFLLPLLGLFLAGCSSNDSLTDVGENPSESVVRNYLSINMVAANGAGMRDADSDLDYEKGTAEENNVNMVRFFFFDKKGEATPVRKKNETEEGEGSGYFSYLDWYPTDGDGKEKDEGEKVERIFHTTLGINIPAGSNFPAKVLAVINPTLDILALGDKPSQSELNNIISDFKTNLTENNFVISNSVYVDKNKEIINATELTDENFCATLSEAEEHPVKIYVERVLARLDFKVDMKKMNGEEDIKTLEDGTTIYLTKKEGYTVGDETSQKIYVKFLGWNITATTDNSRLVKNVSEGWDTEKLFSDDNPWNIDALHRSFWAINPPEDKFNYQYGNFGEGTTDSEVDDNYYPANGNSIPGNVYLQENAAPFENVNDTTTTPTKVIIAAQLVNEDGEPYALAEWAYKKYTPENLLKYLAEGVLNNLYCREKGENYTTARKIEPTDLEYSTVAPGGRGDDARFYVYVVLNKEAREQIWTLGKEENAAQYTADQVNLYIRNVVNHVKVWNTGYTYYYFDVRHLNDTPQEPGYYGIVRNHIYETTVTSVEGLGTPVYNPDEIIYPEKPDYDESIVSADVKILQWRIVSQDYDLKW